ncbi:MAG TPA: discoidin domain-containing protein, partial [Planctomycetota bacterium]|nr:discoidin domain-containing protein [Planctomycetota bacterium]
GKPGWAITDKEHCYLLLKGEGQHSGSISFSLPLQREEDVQKLSGRLLNSTAARLQLSVSGRATMLGEAFPVETTFDDAANTTLFTVGLGAMQSDSGISLSWKRKYDAQKTPPLLLAEQQIAYLLERASPAFNWAARVTIARRRSDELTFIQPPGGRLVRLSGPNVHSWHRDGETIRVLLEKPVLGDIQLKGDGILVAPPGPFELGCFELKDARQDTRYLALLQSPGSRVAIAQSAGFRELALNEQPAALADASKISGGAVARLFVMESAQAKLQAGVQPNPAIFDTQSVLHMVVDEKNVLLKAAYSIQPAQGRIYEVRLTVPSPWTLASLSERQTRRGIKAELSRESESEIWTIALSDAADASQPLNLGATFRLNDPAWGEADWTSRTLKVSTPAVAGARRTNTYLGLSMHPAIDVTFGPMPLWRSELPGRHEQAGISEAALRAALGSDAAGGELSLELSQKKPRGEYELVTHVLTQEREVWVRSDIRLALVDRAVEELTVNLPAEAKDPLYIKGLDIKEIAPGADSKVNQRRVRFNTAWQGVRMLRIEYRAPLAADTDTTIPDIRLDGNFDSRRRLVFQSAGVVKLDVQPGEALQPASLEDTPEFARPFQTGRALHAFTFVPGAAAGTYRSHVLERSPTLSSLARELNLTTTIDASGMSRTHADFLLSYARQQYMAVKLPLDATLIGLYVDGQSVRPVKASAPGVLSVPLPPRSFAQIEMVYQRQTAALGNSGTWDEFAPDLLEIPVGATNWKIHYPPSYHVDISGGNVASEQSQPPQFFAATFWSRLFSGQYPRWTAWETPPVAATVRLIGAEPQRSTQLAQPQAGFASQQLLANENAGKNAEPKERIAGALSIPEGVLLRASKLGGAGHAVLAYRESNWSRFAARSVFLLTVLFALWLARARSSRAALQFIGAGLLLGTLLPPALDWQSPLLMIPFCEGLSLSAVGALFALAFAAVRKRQISAPAAATAAILFIALAGYGANAGESVLIPYAKEDVKSPDADPAKTKVYVPKSVFLELMARANPEKQPAEPEMPTLDDRRNLALSASGAIVSGGQHPERLIDGKPEGFAYTNWKSGQAFVITLAKAEPVERVRIHLPDDPRRFSRYTLELSEDGTRYTTLLDRTRGNFRGWQTHAFTRRTVKSIRLTGTYDSGDDGRFNVADVEVLTPATPVRAALGNAAYSMAVNDGRYTCTGTLEVITFDAKGWAKVPLDFGISRLVALTINGQPASIAHERGIPFVQIHGSGTHTLGVELQGPVALSPGRAQLNAQVVCGTATRVSISLPGDVEIETKSLPAGAWIEKDAAAKSQRCELDLGSSAKSFSVAWQSPDIRAKGASQIASRSYQQLLLGPDGYSVARIDRIGIDGNPVDQLSFKIIGNWEIASVTAPDLAEWNVTGEGAGRRLRLYFQKPVSNLVIQASGWAPFFGSSEQVAALSLENAVRQDGFIGLQHGNGRRFTVASLSALKRASTQDLSAVFSLPAENLPDRLYHWHESLASATLSAEADVGQVSIETQLVGVILPEQLIASARSRYTASGRAPLRHEVDLPAGWNVRTVRCSAMRDWEVLELNGRQRLVVYFSTRAAQGTEIIWAAESKLQIQQDKLALDLPLPRCAGDSKVTESIDWVLAADDSLSLSQAAGTTMTPVPIERAPQWVRLDARQSYRFAFRSAKADSKLLLEVSRQASVGSAVVVSFVRAADENVQVNARCRLRIEQAGRDRFTFKLPAGAKLISLNARNLRSREVLEKPDGDRVTALLQSAVSGEQIIDLAFRLPRQPGQDISVDSIVIEDGEIKQTEHFVGVMQAERGLVAVAARKGLNKTLEIEELPFVPQNVSRASLTAAYAAEADWSLTLRQPDVKVETGQAAEVSLAVLKTVIAADGGVRSIATYSIRNRALQFLQIQMPADGSLWGVLVDGQPVTVSHAQQGGANILLIPIQRMSLTDLPIEVALIYESARIPLPAAYQSFTPLAPKVLDMPVVQTYWQLYVPEDYEVTRTGGNVKDVASSVLIGGRLTSNINEVERLVKIADNAESSYQRRKALRNLARKQQELNDNATVLNNVGRAINDDELKRIGRDELNMQITGNSGVQQQAQMWQMRLNERSKDIEEAVAGGADAEQQQAFFDTCGFLENGWRGGQRFKQVRADAPRPATGDVPLAELLNLRAFAGFGKGEIPPPPASHIARQKEPLPAEGGLREGGDGQLLVEKGAADLRVQEKGTRLTFRRVEGHPELTITMRSKTSSWRYGSIVALVAIALAFGVLRFKKK